MEAFYDLAGRSGQFFHCVSGNIPQASDSPRDPEGQNSGDKSTSKASTARAIGFRSLHCPTSSLYVSLDP